MKCLVTGAAGLIGHEICEQLYNRGYKVWATDNNFRGKAVPKCHHWLHGNLIDILSELDTDFDFVYHMAAINGTSYFYEIPNTLLKNNIDCDLSLFEWSKKCTDLTALVYGSSSELVAGSPNHCTGEELDIFVKDLHNPRWSYRLAKMVAENYLSNSNLPWVAIRYYNVYGHNSKSGHFVFDQIQNITQGIYKLIGADETRSFCFVTDAVDASIQVAEKTCKVLINIGSDVEVKILDAANIIAQSLGKTNYTWDIAPGRIGSTPTRVPNLSLLRSIVVDYNPRSFAEGINEIIKVSNHVK